ncbi:MAG: hypothetical protein LBT84_03315 [Spirochaetia bacterium]|nr:hypothetical protein [Spirochaetia bacterium]
MRRRYFGAFIIIFILAAVYIFVLGESGIFERVALGKKKEYLLARIESLKEDNQKLQNVIDSKITASDFLNAGFIPADKRVLVLKGLGAGSEKPPAEIPAASGIQMTYLRVIFCVLSTLILLFYFSRRNTADDD